MNTKPTPEEFAVWQRRLASHANNRAWTLAESLSRSPEEDEEMLQAAYAAMYFWNIVGNDVNRARAAQLVAHVCALLGFGATAATYFAKAQPTIPGENAEPWERAMALAVAANVAAANKDTAAHRERYNEARRLIEGIPERENREILMATLRVVPLP